MANAKWDLVSRLVESAYVFYSGRLSDCSDKGLKIPTDDKACDDSVGVAS